MTPEKNLPKEIIQASLNNDEATGNREVILSWYESGGAFELTPSQDKLRLRWESSDELLRRNLGKKRREEIVNLLMLKWNISRATAFKDIADAEYVFSTSTPLNTKYLVQIKIEALEADIRDARIAKDFKAVAMLEKVQQGYIEMYPQEHEEKSPRNIIYNFDPTKFFKEEELPTYEDAEFTIDEAINQLPDGLG